MRLTVTSGHDAQQVTHDWHDRVFAVGLARRSPSAACLSWPSRRLLRPRRTAGTRAPRASSALTVRAQDAHRAMPGLRHTVRPPPRHPANPLAGCRAAVLRSWWPPGPGFAGFRCTGRAAFARMFLNPRRTRAGVSRPGGAGRSQGPRRSAASGRASRSWAWAVMMIQVHWSAACGSRIFGTVHPRIGEPGAVRLPEPVGSSG